MGKQIRNTEKAGLEGHCSMVLPPSVIPKTGNRNLLDLLSPQDEAAAVGSFTSIWFHHSDFGVFSPPVRPLVVQIVAKAKV